MELARKGRSRVRASRGTSEAPGSRLTRAQALRQQLINTIYAHEITDLPDEVLDALDDLVDKITHGTPGDDDEVSHLDNECLYGPSEREQHDNGDQTQSSFSHATRLEHHINLRAGRSSVHRPREKYFPPTPEVEPEEQKDRSHRTEEANLRKATSKARDLAVAEDCGLWVTLTVDDLHLGQLTPRVVSNFLTKVSRRHKKQTDTKLHYVGVIGLHGRSPHVHGLFSRGLDPEVIRHLWPYGAVTEIIEIAEEEIEVKVRYMANNIREHRLSHSRFFRSRGAKGQKIVLPVDSVEEARAQLTDLIGPEKPRLMSAQPFGENPRYAFRFKPVRGEGHG